MYSTIKSTKGVRYMRNGKLIKTIDVPEDVMELLKDHATVEEAHEKTDKSCIFCGEPGNRERFLNGRIIYLCEKDYYDKTTGKTVQRLHEIEGAKDAVEEGKEQESSGDEHQD